MSSPTMVCLTEDLHTGAASLASLITEVARRIDDEARAVIEPVDEMRERREVRVSRSLGSVAGEQHVGAAGDPRAPEPALEAEALVFSAAMLLDEAAGLPDPKALPKTDEVDPAGLHLSESSAGR
jgi:hypothetical protein